MDKKNDNNEFNKALKAWKEIVDWAVYDKPLTDESEDEE